MLKRITHLKLYRRSNPVKPHCTIRFVSKNCGRGRNNSFFEIHKFIFFIDAYSAQSISLRNLSSRERRLPGNLSLLINKYMVLDIPSIRYLAGLSVA
uniref:Uncharacterized protein n=1 Tax=Anopheles albimanus TaxID=7167 RepID=A0A182FZJ0_ANOAL